MTDLVPCKKCGMTHQIIDEIWGCGCRPTYEDLEALLETHEKHQRERLRECYTAAIEKCVKYLREEADTVSHDNPYAGDDANATLKQAANDIEGFLNRE